MTRLKAQGSGGPRMGLVSNCGEVNSSPCKPWRKIHTVRRPVHLSTSPSLPFSASIFERGPTPQQHPQPSIAMATCTASTVGAWRTGRVKGGTVYVRHRIKETAATHMSKCPSRVRIYPMVKEVDTLPYCPTCKRPTMTSRTDRRTPGIGR